MKKITAIKIDVEKQEVYSIEIDKGLKGLYTAIGCTCVDRIVLDDRNDLWLDDEGLLKNPQPDKFSVKGYVRPLAGNALICGYNRDGETISTTLKPEQIQPLITFWGELELPIEPAIVVSW